ncbi:MAG TPA: hypothetical protein VNT54_15785 [Solirubrobacteraceae bacterium]|nr:hypothetical protein [Solirubrobacteraceae bacterium]
MIAYKFLRSDGRGVFTGFRWPLPEGAPGAWVHAHVDPCRSGIHACRVGDLPLWFGAELYEIELEGDVVHEPSKLIAARARLLRRIDRWDDGLRADYVSWCAGRAHEMARGAALDGYDVMVDPCAAQGGASVGFVVARIAEELHGMDGYRAERGRQAEWLAQRLGVSSQQVS